MALFLRQVEGCSKVRERASARNAIVEKYASILPTVQRRLLFEQQHVPKKNTQWRREGRCSHALDTRVAQPVGLCLLLGCPSSHN